MFVLTLEFGAALSFSKEIETKKKDIKNNCKKMVDTQKFKFNTKQDRFETCFKIAVRPGFANGLVKL